MKEMIGRVVRIATSLHAMATQAEKLRLLRCIHYYHYETKRCVRSYLPSSGPRPNCDAIDSPFSYQTIASKSYFQPDLTGGSVQPRPYPRNHASEFSQGNARTQEHIVPQHHVYFDSESKYV